MSLRTVMIFPEFENMEIIDNIRRKYDPLAELVRPHITIAFPFESSMSNEELSAILDIRLKDVKPFEVILSGFSMQENSFGNYILLNVQKGMETLKYINQQLYSNEFKEFDKSIEYVPHITVGKLPTAELMKTVFGNLESVTDTFRTIVNKISVEVIGENEESIIVIEKDL